MAAASLAPRAAAARLCRWVRRAPAADARRSRLGAGPGTPGPVSSGGAGERPGTWDQNL